LFPKVKSHLIGRLFRSISDIQKAVTGTLNTIAQDDFCKGIRKLYDRANLCTGMYIEKQKIKVPFLSCKYCTFYNASPKT
jgi:hypothetical protein